MTVVTTRPRKRPAKAAQAATIKVPQIVQNTPKGQAVEVAAAGRSGGQGAGCRALVADDPAEVLSGRRSLVQPFYSILEQHDHFCVG
jgi:hypothetical protein